MKKPTRRAQLSRRRFLKTGAAGVAATCLPWQLGGGLRPVRADGHTPPRYLFVISGTGGASISDSFLPVTDSEAGSHAAGLNVYPQSMLHQNGELRAWRTGQVVDWAGNALFGSQGSGSKFSTSMDAADFLDAHADAMAILPCQVSSVNHIVAAQRAMTGNDVDGGRTILEAMAATYGGSMPLPAVTMSIAGYAEPGTDPTLPGAFRAEPIPDPSFFALATDGQRGIRGLPGATEGQGLSPLLARARAVRGQLEGLSPFGQTFRDDPLRGRFLAQRTAMLEALEGAGDGGLIRQVLIPNTARYGDGLIGLLASAGLSPADVSPEEAAIIANEGPRLFEDSVMLQALLGYRLVKSGVTCAVGLGPDQSPDVAGNGTLYDTPIGYDFSHTSHAPTQGLMWSRVLKATDFLIQLLKQGGLWEQSLIVVLTEFGRSKSRPANQTAAGSGHHLNNGVTLISPLVQGGKVYGAIDPTTLLSRKWDWAGNKPIDLATGTPPSGQHVWTESDIYGAVARVLDIQTGSGVNNSEFDGLKKT
jgi:hypothetical protein